MLDNWQHYKSRSDHISWSVKTESIPHLIGFKGSETFEFAFFLRHCWAPVIESLCLGMSSRFLWQELHTYPYSISRFFGFAISKNNKYRKLVADMFLIRRLKSLTIGFNHATRRPNMNVNTFVFFFVQLLPSSAHRGFCFSVVGLFRGHRHSRSRLDSPVPGRVLQALSYNLDHLPLTTSR